MKKLKKTEETEVTDVDRHYFPPYIWLCRSYIRLCHPPLNSKPDFCSNQAHNSDGKEHLISENVFFLVTWWNWVDPPPLREGLNWCKLDYLTTHPDKDRHYNHFLHHHHHPPPLNFLKALKNLSCACLPRPCLVFVLSLSCPYCVYFCIRS